MRARASGMGVRALPRLAARNIQTATPRNIRAIAQSKSFPSMARMSACPILPRPILRLLIRTATTPWSAAAGVCSEQYIGYEC